MAFVLVASIISLRPSFFQKKPMQFLGKINYPFYLLHGAGMTLVYNIAFITVGVNPAHRLELFIYLALASVAATIPAAYLVHIFIEKPGIKAGQFVSESIMLWWQNKITNRVVFPLTQQEQII